MQYLNSAPNSPLSSNVTVRPVEDPIQPLHDVLELDSPGEDETTVYFDGADCLTIVQQTEFGETMTVVLSKHMVSLMFPHIKEWHETK